MALVTGTPAIRIGYANPEDPALKRTMIRLVEFISGQPKLQRLYDQHKHLNTGQTFFEGAIERLQLDLNFDPAALASIPKTGPLVVVANHPYGVLDGMAAAWLVTRVRPDIKILAHGVLYREEELRRYLIPIYFEGSSSSLRENVQAKRDGVAHVRNGGAVIIFPAGRVSTAERVFGAAVDSPWKTYAAGLIKSTGASVVPLHFSGQNSWLFHAASRFGDLWREALIMYETARRIGSRLEIRIGSPIPPEALAGYADRAGLLDRLRGEVEALAHRPL